MSMSRDQAGEEFPPDRPYRVGTLAYGKLGLKIPMYMRVLPMDRYGQFASANALIRSLATVVGGFLAGLFLDLMKHIYGGSDYAYRFIPVWSIFWSVIALFFLWRLYGDWKRLPEQAKSGN
jgi:hypothetical protein